MKAISHLFVIYSIYLGSTILFVNAMYVTIKAAPLPRINIPKALSPSDSVLIWPSEDALIKNLVDAIECAKLPEIEGFLNCLREKYNTSDFLILPMNKPLISYAHSIEVIKLLINWGVRFTHQGKDGNTPLHEFVKESRLDLVKLLIEHSADPNVKNNMTQTPKDLAKGNQGVLNALDEYEWKRKERAARKGLMGQQENVLAEIQGAMETQGAAEQQSHTYENTGFMSFLASIGVFTVIFILLKGAIILKNEVSLRISKKPASQPTL